MNVTIKDIAEKANVSTATVSHIINKTRYVSPELSQKVMAIMEETGYKAKIKDKAYQQRVGKLSEIAYVIPSFTSALYTDLGQKISFLINKEGYKLVTYLSNGDLQTEKTIIANLITNKRTAGLILIPIDENVGKYQKLMNSPLPFVCVDRAFKDYYQNCVLSENKEALFKGTSHLIKSGHQKIGLIISSHASPTRQERLEGYQQALLEHGLQFDENLVVLTDSTDHKSNSVFSRFNENFMPTAFIACGNALTNEMLKEIKKLGLEYPKDVSVIGFGDDSWCDIVTPALTTLTQRRDSMAEAAATMLFGKLEQNNDDSGCVRIPVDLTIRDSTKSIECGPFGEKVYSPEHLFLTDAQKDAVKEANYNVGISFHYSGIEFTRLYEKAMRDTFEKLGIRVVTVTDSQFDANLQLTQLEGMRLQKLDAIISLPVDGEITSSKYKELAETTKLIFISGLPQGLSSEDYASIVSVNEHQNGRNAGKILGDYFKGQEEVKIGLIKQGSPHFIARQRDFAAEQILTDSYPNIEITAEENFYRVDNAYAVTKSMMAEHPEIQGLYVSWDDAAYNVIKALEDIGRTDVSISTADLDYRTASYMAKGQMVRGVAAQRPYEQGEAAALATANALLGKTQYKCIGVEPKIVVPNNLNKAWTEILKRPVPDFFSDREL